MPPNGEGESTSFQVNATPLGSSLDVQQPFSGLITPQFWGLELANYTDITPPMIEAVSANRLRPYLMHLDKIARQSVDGVALLPNEGKLIIRNVIKFDENIERNSESGRLLLAHQETRDTRVIEVRREALTNKMGKMAVYLSNTLEPDEKIAERINGYAWEPWARRQKGINIVPDLFKVKGILFDDILKVVGKQKRWNEEQSDWAKRALDVRLHFDEQNRVRNWRRMLKLSIDYTRSKRRIFSDRIEEANNLLESLGSTPAS